MEETYQYQDDWTDADRQQPFTYGGYGGYPYPRPRPRLDKTAVLSVSILLSVLSFLSILPLLPVPLVMGKAKLSGETDSFFHFDEFFKTLPRIITAI